MKLCTTCGRRWDVIGPRCPDDGTALVAEPGPGSAEPAPSATWSAQQPALALSRAAPRDELSPGACVGEYVIERKIGAGGMGVVYGARHPVIGKRAAIKILNAKMSADDEALSRFVLEAQAVNRIGHANIVDIFSFGTLDDGRSYFAMEWLQGETLGQRLGRGPLSVREATTVLSVLCRALEAAHAAGVIHRDLKPDNVFLAADDEGWRVKLLDFGIAKLSTATTSVSRTATGVAVGTPLYMAPEQARGELVDGRTDVYALGLLAYTAVCGEALFQDESSPVEILAAHISRPPPSPRVHAPDLPIAFEQLILEMIDKLPDARPTLARVRQELAAIAAAAPADPPAAGQPTMQVAVAQLPPSRPPTMPGVASMVDAPTGDVGAPRRRRWLPGLAALAVFAAGGAWIAVRRTSAPASPARPDARLAAAPSPARPSPPPSAPPPSSPPAAVVSVDAAVAPVEVVAPASAASDATGSAPATAELVVEPGGARVSVDGQPVTLVGGRANLVLAPGDHAAIASLGGRSTRKRFTVTAGHPAKVSLRVPVPVPLPDEHAAPHTEVDVDSVHDPFHR